MFCFDHTLLEIEVAYVNKKAFPSSSQPKKLSPDFKAVCFQSSACFLHLTFIICLPTGSGLIFCFFTRGHQFCRISFCGLSWFQFFLMSNGPFSVKGQVCLVPCFRYIKVHSGRKSPKCGWFLTLLGQETIFQYLCPLCHIVLKFLKMSNLNI